MRRICCVVSVLGIRFQAFSFINSFLSIVLLSCFLLLGCSSGESTSNLVGVQSTNNESTSPEIRFLETAIVAQETALMSRASGGQVSLGGATLSIAPGALSQDASIGLAIVDHQRGELSQADGASLNQIPLSPNAYLISTNRAVDIAGAITLTIPFNEQLIPANVSVSDINISSWVGGYVIPQGKPDTVDMVNNTVTLALDVPRLNTNFDHHRAFDAPRGSLFFLAAGTVIATNQLLNPIFASLDDINASNTGLTRYRTFTQSGSPILIYYNTDLVSAATASNVHTSVVRAHNLYVNNMDFALPNLLNLDGKYALVLDDLSAHRLLPRDKNGNPPDGITLPGSLLFEGASYINAKTLDAANLNSTAVHEYFHAVTFGVLSSPFISNLLDSRVNSRSGWLFEGAATAMAGRLSNGGGVSPARDSNLGALGQEKSLFDPAQSPAPDVAQDFFYFLERRLGNVQFYKPVFSGLTATSLLGVRERGVESLDQQLRVFSENQDGLGLHWQWFIEDFRINNRHLYTTPNAKHILVASPKQERKKSINLPPLSYTTVQVTIPALELDASGREIPGQKKDLKLTLDSRGTGLFFDYYVLEDNEFDTEQLLTDFQFTGEKLEKTLTGLRQSSPRFLTVLISNSDLEIGDNINIELAVEMVAPELTVSLINNRGGNIIVSPSDAQIAAADIRLSGSVSRPTISWSIPNAIVVWVVDAELTGGSQRIPYGISSEYIDTDLASGDGFYQIINSPLAYGDYSRADTETFDGASVPAPALTPGSLYTVFIGNEFGEQASLSFMLNEQ